MSTLLETGWAARRAHEAAQAGSRGSASWGLLLAAGALTVATCGFAALSSARLDRQNLTLDAQVRAAKDALKQRKRLIDEQSSIAPSTHDFVQGLPDSIDLQPILSALQRSAADAGVAFVGLLVQERPVTKETAFANRSIGVLARPLPQVDPSVRRDLEPLPERHADSSKPPSCGQAGPGRSDDDHRALGCCGLGTARSERNYAGSRSRRRFVQAVEMRRGLGWALYERTRTILFRGPPQPT